MDQVWTPKNDLLHQRSEVYSLYECKQVIPGEPHPVPLIEGTALASVRPPSVEFDLLLDAGFYRPGKDGTSHVSLPQIEAMLYALRSFRMKITEDSGKVFRQGFYLGDGCGVGKSRVLAGIANECFRRSDQKAIWVTASQRLYSTIRQEMRAFHDGVNIIKFSELGSSSNPTAISSVETDQQSPTLLMVTYKTLEYEKEVKKIGAWMGIDFDGLVIFDEYHFCKSAEDNNKPSTRGKNACILQEQHPQAKVVYSTATGASELNHLLPFVRLGLWGREAVYRTKNDMCNKLQKRGIGALEVLALDMKMRGVFVSRQISYKGVDTRLLQVEEDENFTKIYHRCSELLLMLVVYMQRVKAAYIANNRENDADYLNRNISRYMSFFFARAQDFCGNMIISSKIKTVIQAIKEAKKRGECSVIGMQHTGESNFGKYEDEKRWSGGIGFSLAAYFLRAMIRSLGIRIGCPKLYIFDQENPVPIGQWTSVDEDNADMVFKDMWNTTLPPRPTQAPPGYELPQIPPIQRFEISRWPKNSVGATLRPQVDPAQMSWSYNRATVEASADSIARMYHELVPFLPINPLDHVVNYCVEKKLQVAEMTGRKKRHMYDSKTQAWVIEKKPDSDDEFERFSLGIGKKAVDVAIISACSSTGVSLHSDKTLPNNRKRNQFTLEYSWGPEGFLQQLGRTHRSNQLHPPTYFIIASNVPAEERYIATIAKRLKQMGAICHGSLNASLVITKYLSDDLCTVTGARAVNLGIEQLQAQSIWCKQLLDRMEIGPITLTPNREQQGYYSKWIEEQVNKIFNRILMFPLALQRFFFQTVRHEYEILTASQEIYAPLREINLMQHEHRIFSQDTLLVNGHETRLIGIRVDRTASSGFCERFLLENPSWEYYTRGDTECLLASPEDKDTETVRVIFPFCRYQTTIKAEVLRRKETPRWTKAGPFSSNINNWEHALFRIKTNPHQCIERRYGHDSCHLTVGEKRKCMHKWGIFDFYILTNPNCKLVEALDDGAVGLQLSRVFVNDNGTTREIFGLYIGNDNVSLESNVRVAEQLRHAYRI